MLDRSLSKYYELLLDRQKLIEETSELNNQNEELKNLLNQYIQVNNISHLNNPKKLKKMH